MASLNSKTYIPPPRTHEGTIATRQTPLQELIRLTMACMLWEDNFYESGKSLAERVQELVHTVSLREAYGVALEARNNMKLRHVPLLIACAMACAPQTARSFRGSPRRPTCWRKTGFCLTEIGTPT